MKLKTQSKWNTQKTNTKRLPNGVRDALKSVVNFGKLPLWWSKYVIKLCLSLCLVEYLNVRPHSWSESIDSNCNSFFNVVENCFDRWKCQITVNIHWIDGLIEDDYYCNRMISTINIPSICKHWTKYFEQTQTYSFNRKNKLQLKTSAINSTASIFEMLNLTIVFDHRQTYTDQFGYGKCMRMRICIPLILKKWLSINLKIESAMRFIFH